MYKTEIYFYLQVTLKHTTNIPAKFASNHLFQRRWKP